MLCAGCDDWTSRDIAVGRWQTAVREMSGLSPRGLPPTKFLDIEITDYLREPRCSPVRYNTSSVAYVSCTAIALT